MILTFYVGLSQNLNGKAKVISFYEKSQLANQYNEVEDTLINQYRKIYLNKDILEIDFSVYGDEIKQKYKISKKFIGYRMVGITKILRKYGNKYTYYFGYDVNLYPIVLCLSIDKKTAFLYYYYKIENDTFCKYESLDFTKK